MSVINSDPHFHLRRNLATSRVWAEAPVAFQPSLDLHPLSVRECWLCVHEPPHGAVPFLSYVLLWPFHALSCSKEVLPFQRAFPVLLSYRRLIMLSRSGMRCITTRRPQTTKARQEIQLRQKLRQALGASEHSGKLFKSKVGANGFEPSTSCSQGCRRRRRTGPIWRTREGQAAASRWR